MIIKKFPASFFPRSNKERASQRVTRLRAKNMLLGLTLLKFTAHTNTKSVFVQNLALWVQHQTKNQRERNGQEKNMRKLYIVVIMLQKSLKEITLMIRIQNGVHEIQ